MATKGSKKITDKITGLFKKETPQDEMRREQVQLAKNRTREENLIAKLNTINFADPANKLSPEFIKEKGCQSVVRYAVNELKNPPIIPQDIEELDKYIDLAVDALSEAVKEGLESTAEWSSVALYTAITTLRTEVTGIDADNADALMESKLDYARNLEIIIKASREYDRINRDLKAQRKRRDNKRAELEKLKNLYKQKRDTVEGMKAVAEIEQYAGSPSLMSDEAKALADDLYQIHRLKGECTEIEMDISTKEVELQQKTTEIESTRNRLATPPQVADPKLQEKINKASELYRDSLRRRLNAARESSLAYERHLSEIRGLMEHTVFVDRMTVAINEDNAIQMEEIESQQRTRETLARMRKRQEEKALIKLENQELEQLIQKEAIENLQADVEEDVEEEQQVEEIFVME